MPAPARLLPSAAALVFVAVAGCAGRAPAQPAWLEVGGADVARGRRLAAQFQCGACHRIPGVAGAAGMLAPPLDGIGRRSYIAGDVPNAPETLMRWLQDPASVVPGTQMPKLGVGPADARDLAAFLMTLR